MAFTLSAAAQHATQLLNLYGPNGWPYQSFVQPYRAAAEQKARQFSRAQRRLVRPRCGLCQYTYGYPMLHWQAFESHDHAVGRGTDYLWAGINHEQWSHGIYPSAVEEDNKIWNECVNAMTYRGQFPDGQSYGDIYGTMAWEQRFRLAQDTLAEVERRLAMSQPGAFSAQALGARTCWGSQRADLWRTAQVTTQGLHLQRHFNGLYAPSRMTPTYDRWRGGLKATFTDWEQAWEEEIVPWIDATVTDPPTAPTEDDNGGGFDPAHWAGVTWSRIVEMMDIQDRNTAPSPVVSTGLRG